MGDELGRAASSGRGGTNFRHFELRKTRKLTPWVESDKGQGRNAIALSKLCLSPHLVPVGPGPTPVPRAPRRNRVTV